MKKLFFVLMLAGLVAAGCAHRNTVQNGPQAGQEGPSAVKQSQVEKQGAAQQGASANLSSEQAGKKEAAGEKIADIHFEFDKYNLKPDAKPVLKEVAGLLLKDGKVRVAIEGNCDEKGTEEYNLALGDRRAQEAKTYLVALGVPADRIQTVSNGKEKPLCHESSEKCWARNRRDHFVFSGGTN